MHPNPDAKKPDDWNEVMDGEWERALVPNLKYEVRGSLLPRGVRNKTRD